MVPAALPDSSLPTARSWLAETLRIEEARTVGRDSAIAWESRRLQVPESPLRRHYVTALVQAQPHPKDTLGVPLAPRVIGR